MLDLSSSPQQASAVRQEVTAYDVTEGRNQQTDIQRLCRTPWPAGSTQCMNEFIPCMQ